MKDIVEKLKKYFEETPIEKVLEEWEKTKELDNVGVTVEYFLKNTNENIKKNALVLEKYTAYQINLYNKFYEELNFILSENLELVELIDKKSKLKASCFPLRLFDFENREDVYLYYYEFLSNLSKIENRIKYLTNHIKRHHLKDFVRKHTQSTFLIDLL